MLNDSINIGWLATVIVVMLMLMADIGEWPDRTKTVGLSELNF